METMVFISMSVHRSSILLSLLFIHFLHCVVLFCAALCCSVLFCSVLVSVPSSSGWMKMISIVTMMFLVSLSSVFAMQDVCFVGKRLECTVQ